MESHDCSRQKKGPGQWTWLLNQRPSTQRKHEETTKETERNPAMHARRSPAKYLDSVTVDTSEPLIPRETRKQNRLSSGKWAVLAGIKRRKTRKHVDNFAGNNMCISSNEAAKSDESQLTPVATAECAENGGVTAHTSPRKQSLSFSQITTVVAYPVNIVARLAGNPRPPIDEWKCEVIRSHVSFEKPNVKLSEVDSLLLNGGLSLSTAPVPRPIKPGRVRKSKFDRNSNPARAMFATPVMDKSIKTEDPTAETEIELSDWGSETSSEKVLPVGDSWDASRSGARSGRSQQISKRFKQSTGRRGGKRTNCAALGQRVSIADGYRYPACKLPPTTHCMKCCAVVETTSWELMERHVISHGSRMPYTCALCSSSFLDAELAEQHEHEVHGSQTTFDRQRDSLLVAEWISIADNCFPRNADELKKVILRQ